MSPTPPIDNSAKALRAACDTIYANAPDIGGGRLARIALDLLHLEDYQRNEDGRHVNKIAKNWDESKCDPLSVAYREGKFFVDDGQHRLAAARLLGNPDIKCIINKRTYNESCKVFMEQNIGKKRVSVYNQLMAGAKAGYEPYTDIMKICKNHPVILTESTRPNPGECGSASALLRIYNRCSRRGLLWVLDMVRCLNWSESHNGYSGDILESLANVFHKSRDLDMVLVQKKILSKVKITSPTMTIYASPNMTISNAHAAFPGRSNKTALTEYFLA